MNAILNRIREARSVQMRNPVLESIMFHERGPTMNVLLSRTGNEWRDGEYINV